MSVISRRTFVGGAAVAVSLASSGARATGGTLRVGYQKYGNLLLLKATGLLEERLKPLGWSVAWKSFVSGPPLMEALGAGALDFGVAGETPPIFAQAAGAPIVYLGSELPSPRGEAILVHEDSPIKALADLRGKKVAVTKGSNVNYLYVRALEKAGLSPTDVTPVYLAPADGRAAFERGSVDAWAIWDPFFAAGQAALRTRVLTDGSDLVANRQFYIGSRRFTDEAVTDTFRKAIVEIDRQTVTDPGQAAELLSASVGIPAPVLRAALQRQSWSFRPIDATIVQDQQVIADTFHKLGLIPKAIKVSDALPSA